MLIRGGEGGGDSSPRGGREGVRLDARDTGAALLIRGGDGAALLIRGGGALGVETPAHEEGREAGVGRKAGWRGAEEG